MGDRLADVREVVAGLDRRVHDPLGHQAEHRRDGLLHVGRRDLLEPAREPEPADGRAREDLEARVERHGRLPRQAAVGDERPPGRQRGGDPAGQLAADGVDRLPHALAPR